MSSIILDVRSAESNDPSTGLGERYVLGHTLLDGTRPYRDLYSDQTEQILWSSLGDGDISPTSQIEISNLGSSSQAFIYRVSVIEAEDQAGNPLQVNVEDLGYRITSSSVIGRIVLQKEAPLFMWTKSEAGRARIGEYKGRAWSLLGGKKIVIVGRVGDDEYVIEGSGELILGGVYSEDLTRHEIGGSTLPIVSESELDSYVFTTEVGAVGDESFKIRFNGGEGQNIYFASSVLGGDGVEVTVDDYLAGGLRDGEYPLIRSARGEGYVDVEVVADESGFVGGLNSRGLRVALSSGAIERGSALTNSILFFEGVALGFSTPLDYVDVSSEPALPVRSGLLSSGLSYLPDGTGIIPTGAAPSSSIPTGTGLILGLEAVEASHFIMDGQFLKTELVDRLPSRMKADRVYVLSEDFSIHSSKTWTSLLFRQALVPMIGLDLNLAGAEMLGLTEPSFKGFYRLEGDSAGEITGDSLFFFLDFIPRKDMDGSFKAGNKTLVEGTDFQYRLDDGKIEWVKESTSAGAIREPSYQIPLGLGAKAGTISITLEQELSEGVRTSETLIEGTDFELSIDGQNALLTSDLSYREKIYGSNSSEISGGRILLPNSLGTINEGDWVVFNGDRIYRKIVGLDEGSYVLSNTEGIVHPSSWVVYDRGYTDGNEVSNPSLLNNECFKSVPLTYKPDLRLFKSKSSLASLLSERAQDSLMFVEGATGTRYELRLLVPEPLEETILDLTDPHVASNKYYLKVGVLGPLYQDTDFTLSAEGEIQFNVVVGGEQILLYRTPMTGLTTYAETDGTLIEAPESVSIYLEQVFGFNFERTSGNVSLDVPLRRGEQIYLVYRPEGETDYVKETSSFVVNREICTRIDARTYSFNPDGLALYPDSSVIVDAGAERVGYLDSRAVEVQGDSTLILPFDVENGVNVKIDYIVSSALGGERLAQTTDPIAVKSLILDEGATSFEAENVVNDHLVVGALIKIGDHSFTVDQLNIVSDTTTVTFSPPARYGVSGPLSVLSNGDIFYGVGGVGYSSAVGSNEIILEADLSSIIYNGSYLIFGSESFRISEYEILETGATKIIVEGITAGLSGTGNMLLSARPVPVEGSQSLQLRTQVLLEKGTRLIRYDGSVGVELEQGLDYAFNGSLIELKGEHKIQQGISYYLHHTALSQIAPKTMRYGRVSYPNYSASFLSSDTGAQWSGFNLNAYWYYEARDQFYLRKESEDTYISEKIGEIISFEQSVEGKSSGTRFTGTVSDGRAIGRHDLEAEDFVVREMIKRYDYPIKTADLIRSTMTGEKVGDADGLFRMEIERSGYYGGAGLEDSVLKTIAPRYVTLDLIDNYAPFEPITGENVDALQSAQKKLIYNDMDDYVLVSKSTVVLGGFPSRQRTVYPVYSQMWEAHGESRLFSTKTSHFSELFEGPYDSDNAGSVIGQVNNPARDVITGITGLTLRSRKFRFRVWDYSESGFKEYPSTLGEPTLILSAVPFKDFPVYGDGTIDLSKFLSQGGDIPDLLSGDAELSLPPIRVGAPIMLGSESEPFSIVTDRDATSSTELFGLAGSSEPRIVRVRSIINPCVITLGIYNDSLSLVSPSSLIRDGATLNVSRGFTLLESHGADLDENEVPSRSYNVGTDVGLRSSTGELINITKDFPFDVFYSQNVPVPLTDIEGTVNLGSAGSDPFEFPALKGLSVDDSGDMSIPYSLGTSEQKILPNALTSIGALETLYAGEYVYPDDIRTTGNISNGALTVNASLTPFTDGEVASVDVRYGDLVVIKPSNGSTGDAQTGFSQVAKVDVNSNEIMIPVFTSPIPQGDVIEYEVFNAYLDDNNNNNGIRIAQALSGGVYTTIIQRPTVESNLSYSDLLDSLASNLSGNSVTFKLYAIADTTFQTAIASFEIITTALGTPPTYEITSNLGTIAITSLVATDSSITTVSNSPWFDFSDPGLTLSQDTPTAKTIERHAHSLDIDATSGTTTASIENDRVGFRENYYFRARSKDGLLPTRLLINDCQITLEEIAIIPSQSTTIKSNLNATAPYSLRFNRDIDGHVLEPASWYGDNSSVYNRSNLDIEIWSGAEVNDSDRICEGYGAIDLRLTAMITRTFSQGALGNIEPGDLLVVERGHQAGVYLIGGAYDGPSNVVLVGEMGDPSNQDALGYGVAFPRISAITDNGDGTCDVIVDQDINTEQFAGAGGVSPLVMVLDPDDVNSEPSGTDTVLFAHYESVSGNRFERVGYALFQGHNFVNGKFQSVNPANAITLILGATGGTGFCSGQNRLLAPKFFYEGYGYPFTVSGITVTQSTLHDGAHNPYTFTLSGYDYNSQGEITHFLIDYHNPPVIDSPNNYRAILLPQDSLQINAYIQGGIYLDRSFPRMDRALQGTASNYFGTAPAYGPAPYSNFTLSITPAYTFGDYSNFTVRRLRRFSDALYNLNTSLEGLGLLYAERTGSISSLTPDGLEYTLTASKTEGLDTSAGNFLDVCSVGDVVKLYNANGDQARLRIKELGATLKLIPIAGDLTLNYTSFMLNIRTQVVPEIQALNDLIESAFDLVFEGGYGVVEEDDLLTDPNETFTEDTVNVGDYILVDPQGALEGSSGPASPVEYGQPPKGDLGRQGIPGFSFGYPDPLDDNRGVYKVIEITEDGGLRVEPVVKELSADFHLLPTTYEGEQGTLRVTAPSDVNNSFAGSPESVEGFDYRIIRAVDQEQAPALEWMLFLRERTMSWYEMISSLKGLPPYSWYEYHTRGYEEYIGIYDHTHPSNDLIFNIRGQVQAPFINSRTCLSILDRRALIGDYRMIEDGYGVNRDLGSGYSTEINTALELLSLRDSRFYWISKRIGSLYGTLPRLKRL